jgi:nicotinamidase-related amidase
MMAPEGSILLVIDVVNHCCSPRCETREWGITYRRIRRMVPNLASFIEEYKKRSRRPVVYVKCVRWDKEHVAPNIRELYRRPECDFYAKGRTAFGERFFGVAPGRGDIIITKDSYDAFTNPVLDRRLKRMGIKTLVIAGVFGDGCVDATIQGGFSMGYSLIMLEDLIETTDEGERQGLQGLLKRHTWPKMYGRVVASGEFLNELPAAPGTDDRCKGY